MIVSSHDRKVFGQIAHVAHGCHGKVIGRSKSLLQYPDKSANNPDL